MQRSNLMGTNLAPDRMVNLRLDEAGPLPKKRASKRG